MSRLIILGMSVTSETIGRCDLLLDGIEITGAVSRDGKTVTLRFDEPDQIEVGGREILLRCVNATGGLSTVEYAE